MPPSKQALSQFRPGGLVRWRAVVVIGYALVAFSGPLSAQTHCGTHVKIEDPIPDLIPPSTTQVSLMTIITGLVSPVGGAVRPSCSWT